MLDPNWLKDTLLQRTLTHTDKILVVLLDEEAPEKSPKEIREIFVNHGVREAATWSMSSFLNSAKVQKKVVGIGGKWSLTAKGRDYLQSKGIVIPQTSTVITKARDDIRSHLVKITNERVKDFVEEAIGCLEGRLLRSAVVMSWLGAIAILYEHVLLNNGDAFNKEAKKRKQNWNDAKSLDDLARMKESDFLDILGSLGILGKSVKEELKNCLNLRNACGHPNSYEIGDQKVAAHIEFLIQNVYSKF